jgi:3-methyladenine DNA glycosylase/8-oxoguanine DNA glycosylase
VPEIELVGAGGEPVDFKRTLASHGVADLLPNRLDEEGWTLETTLDIGGRARTVRLSESRPGYAEVTGATKPALAIVRHMLRLDEDLSRFYALIADDAELSWAAQGAGRMLRSPTVFEDVVKTVCTTNCAWSGTVRMVSALVEHLGIDGRTFPSPQAMADAPEDFYRDVARAGYRGAYLQAIARAVADGTLDLEELDGRRRRALRRRARDDAARPLRPPDPRLLDAPDVRAAGEAQDRQGRDDRAPLPPLQGLRGPRLLALPHARLGP